jgi:hypothetical protein
MRLGASAFVCRTIVTPWQRLDTPGSIVVKSMSAMRSAGGHRRRAKNSTIVDGPHEVSAGGEERLLTALAKSVASKDPTRTYYVVSVRPSLATGRSRKANSTAWAIVIIGVAAIGGILLFRISQFEQEIEQEKRNLRSKEQ